MNEPTPAPDGFTRMADRERRIDQALEAIETTATFARELDARLETGVELLRSIDASLRRLVELTAPPTKGNRT